MLALIPDGDSGHLTEGCLMHHLQNSMWQDIAPVAARQLWIGLPIQKAKIALQLSEVLCIYLCVCVCVCVTISFKDGRQAGSQTLPGSGKL